MTEPLGPAIVASLDAGTASVQVDPAALLRAVEGRQRRLARRTRWGSAGAVAASVAAVVAVALVVPVVRGATSTPAVQPSPSTTPAVPAGKQAVSWHGVQLFVPAEWTLDDAICGTPQRDTVLRPGPVDLCRMPSVLGLTVVQFSPLTGTEFSTAPATAAKTPVDLAGTAARRGSRTNIGERYAVLVVPNLQVVVTVSAPTLAEADELLDTAGIVDVDANGCRSRLDSSRAQDLSGREDAAQQLLPGAPTDVSVCRYEELRLEESRRLEPSTIAATQRALDALPTGRSGRRPPEEIAEAYCRSIDDNVTTLDASYAEGPDLTVFLRDQACTDRSPTNGTVTRKLGEYGLGLNTYSLLRGQPLPADIDRMSERMRPAPQLGYDQITPLTGMFTAPAQRADVLARTDDDTAVQLLGLIDRANRLCSVLHEPRASTARPLSCASSATGKPGWVSNPALQGSLDPAGDPDQPMLSGSTPPEVRSVHVLLDGEQIATWATYGGGARYDQRRFFLGRLPSAGRVEVVGLDSLGFDKGRVQIG